MTKIILYTLSLLFVFNVVSAQKADSTKQYKKRVLESAEVDFLMSLYGQKGDHSAVGGGIGNEQLTDITPTIVITIPLNEDDVLTIDAGLSAYSSASSSNINPFNNTRASGGDDDDDDEKEDSPRATNSTPTGTPWMASSGASKSDVLVSVHVDYSHSSNNRNFIWGSNISFSNEYDYRSLGFGGNVTKLFNEKNTELGIKGLVYIDQWKPIYPTELHEFSKFGSSFLNQGYFKGVSVLNQNGIPTSNYHPSGFTSIDQSGRNSFSLSFFLSQIVSKRLQASLFFDLVYQQGLLSTPYHRIYFADKSNYYIGNALDIPNYTTPKNRGVFHLSDDIERLPSTRFKVPIGARINYYVNDIFVLRTYYRYYTDDWGLQAHTANVELPVKLSQSFTFSPAYRFYTQNSVDYFAPYETHLSSEKYYTSDFDLAKFTSNQYSLGLNYTNVFTGFKLYRFGLKNANLKYSHYSRSDGLKANIISLGFKFVFE
jgi:hypothetical protein